METLVDNITAAVRPYFEVELFPRASSPFIHFAARRSGRSHTECNVVVFDLDQPTLGSLQRQSVPGQALLSRLLPGPSTGRVPVLVGLSPHLGLVLSLDASLLLEAEVEPLVYLENLPLRELSACRWMPWEVTPFTEPAPTMVLLCCNVDLLAAALAFEITACGLDQGHRQLVAEEMEADISRLRGRHI